jgi:hypothetical protein
LLDFDINLVVRHHNLQMRTTLNLDEDVLEAVKTYASDRNMPMGKAASQLIKRGLEARCPTRWKNGFLIFDPPPGAPVTAEHVRRLLEEEGF